MPTHNRSASDIHLKHSIVIRKPIRRNDSCRWQWPGLSHISAATSTGRPPKFKSGASPPSGEGAVIEFSLCRSGVLMCMIPACPSDFRPRCQERERVHRRLVRPPEYKSTGGTTGSSPHTSFGVWRSANVEMWRFKKWESRLRDWDELCGRAASSAF